MAQLQDQEIVLTSHQLAKLKLDRPHIFPFAALRVVDVAHFYLDILVDLEYIVKPEAGSEIWIQVISDYLSFAYLLPRIVFHGFIVDNTLSVRFAECVHIPQAPQTDK